ncbi:MAG: YdjY domain-containing protein, partial [Verrucomicrobiota bacterium]
MDQRYRMRLVVALSCTFFCFGFTPLGAQDAEDSKRAAVTQIGDYRYRIGEIEIDAKTREISFPVVVNMREGGPIEYILVHEHGKVHESILTTSISPLNLNVALKLLKFKEGYGDVFNILLPPELLEKEGGTEDERGDGFFFGFVPEGKTAAIPAEDLILDGILGESMKADPWVYTGSKIEGGLFMAES